MLSQWDQKSQGVGIDSWKSGTLEGGYKVDSERLDIPKGGQRVVSGIMETLDGGQKVVIGWPEIPTLWGVGEHVGTYEGGMRPWGGGVDRAWTVEG